MTPERFRGFLEVLGLTLGAFAALMGVDDRTVRRWAEGEKPVPASVALVLVLADRYRLTPADLAAILETLGERPFRQGTGR